MFARRVFEVMALGLYVISNESVGLRALFGDSMSFIGESLPDEAKRAEAIRKNLNYVIKNHSYRSRLLQICDDIGIKVQHRVPVIGAEGETDADCYLTAPLADEQAALLALHFEYLPRGVGIKFAGEGESFVITECQKGDALLYRAADGFPDKAVYIPV